MTSVDGKASKKLWTREEDALLMQLVKEHGTEDRWPTLAAGMDGRTGKQCRERYKNHLDPCIKKTVWTREEDAMIKKLFPLFGSKWRKYMGKLPGRPDNAIKNRFHIISRNNYSEHNENSSMEPKIWSLEDLDKEIDSLDLETTTVRLTCFEAAREILDRKINALKARQGQLVKQDGAQQEPSRKRRPKVCPQEILTAVLSTVGCADHSEQQQHQAVKEEEEEEEQDFDDADDMFISSPQSEPLSESVCVVPNCYPKSCLSSYPPSADQLLECADGEFDEFNFDLSEYDY